MELNTILITQARSGSTRLPGKVLKKIKGKELLRIHLERLQKSARINKIIVATTTETEDEQIVKLVEEWGCSYFRGSENDVLDRFYKALTTKGDTPEWVVRVTSDCPLIDPQLIDEVVKFGQANNVDYVSNTLQDQYPDGQDIEVFKFSALETAWKEAVLDSDREHVTSFIKKNSDYNGGKLFKAKNYPCEKNYSKIRMTVDEKKDFILIKKLINELGTEMDWMTYTNYTIEHGLYKINSDIIRNEGYLKSLKKDEDE